MLHPDTDTVSKRPRPWHGIKQSAPTPFVEEPEKKREIMRTNVLSGAPGPAD